MRNILRIFILFWRDNSLFKKRQNELTCICKKHIHWYWQVYTIENLCIHINGSSNKWNEHMWLQQSYITAMYLTQLINRIRKYKSGKRGINMNSMRNGDGYVYRISVSSYGSYITRMVYPHSVEIYQSGIGSS